MYDRLRVRGLAASFLLNFSNTDVCVCGKLLSLNCESNPLTLLWSPKKQMNNGVNKDMNKGVNLELCFYDEREEYAG